MASAFEVLTPTDWNALLSFPNLHPIVTFVIAMLVFVLYRNHRIEYRSRQSNAVQERTFVIAPSISRIERIDGFVEATLDVVDPGAKVEPRESKAGPEEEQAS
jgi:type II secretory pathway component PulL